MYDCDQAAYHRAEPLEAQVQWFLIKNLLKNPDKLLEALDSFIESERQSDPGPKMAALGERIAELKGRRDRYVEQHAEGIIDLDTLKAKVSGIDRQIESARADIRDLQDQQGRIERLQEQGDCLAEDIRNRPEDEPRRSM